MSGSWWGGTRLVAERSMLESARSRTFRVVTGLLLVLAVGALTVPDLIGHGRTTYSLATIGKVEPTLSASLAAAGRSADFKVDYTAVADRAAVRRAVRDGHATVGLARGTLYASSAASSTFPALVAQTVVAREIAGRMAAMGLTARQIAGLQSVRPPKHVTVGRAQDAARARIGYAVGIILFLALTLAGTAIATTVAMEKSTRISEVLLAMLRPSQPLVGTVLAVGTLTLAQLLVLAVPFAVATGRGGDVRLPAAAGGDIALAVVWFVLGFALYAFAFAAAAALVDKITEVSSAIQPVTYTLIACYVVAIFVANDDPHGRLSVAASLFPLSAPLAMPIRWASGEVPVYQLVLAMALTALTAGLLVAVASSIYRRALLVTGHRVKLREVLGSRAVGL